MRFRVSYQHDSMQCGAACLRMVCKHYGKEYALDFLSEQCGCMIDGVSLQAIREMAEDLGFRTFAVSVGHIPERRFPEALGGRRGTGNRLVA